jgi:tetratricopeptide (TPR) repeat protein
MSGQPPVDWIPALAILLGGLVFGAVLAWRMLKGTRPAAHAVALESIEVRDLSGKSDALLRQLRELDDTASKRNPAQLARERYALELEAARTLLALEQRGPVQAAPAAAAAAREPVVSESRAATRGFLWGIGSAAGLAALGFLVYQAAQPREGGGSVTGNTPMAAQGSEGSVDDHLARAREAVARQDWMTVWNETSRVLERAPGNPSALAYQALVRLAMGQADVALDMLNKALAANPDLIEAYPYLALTQARMGKVRDAEATIAKASKRFPERAADLARFLAEVKKEKAPVAQASTGGTSNPHAGIDKASEDSTPPARSAGPRVAGMILLDPALENTYSPRAVLFVFARAAGATEGPPVAVKRLPASFPAQFELGPADSMMGQAFPEKLLIEARLDSDGDPTTRPPTDPKARIDGVRAGRTDLRLILKRQ